MSAKVLILSKNPIVENEIQIILQSLNLEVFCSSTLFYEVKDNLEIIKYFSLIIISDTISIHELEYYLPILSNCKIPIIKKGEEDQVDSNDLDWLRDGVDGWLNSNSNKTEIIESVAKHLFSATQGYSAKLLSKEKNNFSKPHYLNFVTELTKREKLFLSIVHKREGGAVSRETLCEEMFGGGMSPSRLSQLSALVHNIRIKMISFGLDPEELTTIWGAGYKINESFNYFLKENQFSIFSQ